MSSNDWPVKYCVEVKYNYVNRQTETEKDEGKNCYNKTTYNWFLHVISSRTYLIDKVKMAVKVPLESDGLERAKPLVSKI